MMLDKETQPLCRLFAEILDYPGDTLVASATECARGLEPSFPGIAKPMSSFAAFARSQSPGTLEELYTQTFDISSATTLYLGYHLFGETPQRSAFLVKLEEAYKEHHLTSGTELADHLCVLLKFLSVARDMEFVLPLLQECVLPVLKKIEKAFPKNQNGYGPVISSLRLFLQQVSQPPIKTGGLPRD